jgi:hypothetical protein
MGIESLSDADLMALKSGDLTKVSDAGLLMLKQPASAPGIPGQDYPQAQPQAKRGALSEFLQGVSELPQAIIEKEIERLMVEDTDNLRI